MRHRRQVLRGGRGRRQVAVAVGRLVGGVLLVLLARAPLERDGLADRLGRAERQVAHLLGHLPADLLGDEVRRELGDEAAVLLRLQVAQLGRLLHRRHDVLLAALLRPAHHAAVVRRADLARNLLAPRVRLVLDAGRGLQ